MVDHVDQIRLNFTPESLLLLNIFLALIMFGVALDLKVSDFKRIASIPKPVFVGFFSQFFLLPFLTFVLILIIKPLPSIALGMIMVAACPGGNISNFMTHMAKGNTALSVTLTAFSTLFAIFITPWNLNFWGNLYEPTANILQIVSLNPIDLFKTIFLILGIPLFTGMFVNHRFPLFALKLSKRFKSFSIVFFMCFVVVAFYNNLDIFMEYFHLVIYIVFIHNIVALTAGYSMGRLFKLPYEDQKSLSIETGIQNSGLGLILIFTFFDGLGGMAIVAAWWGIWHIISGLTLSYFWSRKSIQILGNA